MSGRHLILPHRHHVHLRAAMNTPPPKTLGCSMTLESLINAHVTIRQTKGDIAALLSKFLLETRNMSVKNASEFVLYHDLRLSHPLQMEVANKNNDGSDPQSVEEELSKISDTLLILYDLMKKVEIVQPVDVVNQTYGYITSMVHHNLDNTLQMRNMHFDKSSTPSYTYNCSHIFLPYAIINETINVLDVIEKKYNYMLQTCFADAS
ncbi:hypothetical protein KR044_005581 [Drosophila immigrans]|nr:hypothetical protein KR044_005581 [Drosophila immigrans]